MSLSTLLTLWRDTPAITANMAAWRTLPAQPAQTAPFPPDLAPALAAALGQRGIEALYTHQLAAWQAVQAGQHPVIVTGTASGKSLAYNLPVLDHLWRDSAARALYLFPTKALAHDQAEAISSQYSVASSQKPVDGRQGSAVGGRRSAVVVATYDADTPAAHRPAIRQNARLVITNPDMLHTGILPHHTRWAEFFRHLRFVVLDEMHVYRGVFGSHVANVLRRLKRVAQFYGATPQFILTSATLANPVELAERLIEAPVTLIDHDGAARGVKHFLIYNPPLVNPDLGLRRGLQQEAVRLTHDLLAHEVQTLLFGRARRAVEMMLRRLKDEGGEGKDEKESSSFIPHPSSFNVRAYRSGYLPHQRREIERGLRSGEVRGVVATSALELGVDIGGMGAVVLAGYPGSIAATWQQAGRAGRMGEASLAVLVLSADPLEQFLARHPGYFFDRSPEQALINPDNLLILLQHLRCAAFELPFKAGEGFGRVEAAQVLEFLQFLTAAGELHYSANTFYWMSDRYPAEGVSLRSASPERVLLQTAEDDKLTTLGEVDKASAPWLVHPQAIYLHEGAAYIVEELNLEQNLARLRPANGDYYTEPQRETTVQRLAELRRTAVPGAAKGYGEISVTTQLVGYRRVHWFTHEHLGQGEVTLPPTQLQTTGYWLALTAETVAALQAENLWSNAPNDYGPHWPAQRNRVRARDGYRCQMCGAPEMGREHDVHHKIPFRTFDSVEQANQLSNLITLCRVCHRRAETAVRTRSGLGGLAFALGRLAPLFLMCDVADLAVHADPQSPLAEGQPAVVVVYDLVPGGIGLSERLFDLHAEVMARAYELVSACSCADGCPSCVGPAGEGGHGGKRESLAILERLANLSEF